eukprot:7383034-Prymnesium_polylepis.1
MPANSQVRSKLLSRHPTPLTSRACLPKDRPWCECARCSRALSLSKNDGKHRRVLHRRRRDAIAESDNARSARDHPDGHRSQAPHSRKVGWGLGGCRWRCAHLIHGDAHAHRAGHDLERRGASAQAAGLRDRHSCSRSLLGGAGGARVRFQRGCISELGGLSGSR